MKFPQERFLMDYEGIWTYIRPISYEDPNEWNEWYLANEKECISIVELQMKISKTVRIDYYLPSFYHNNFIE